MAAEIGGTVGELEEVMSYRELLEWNEFFKVRNEAEKKASSAAKKGADKPRRPPRAPAK